MQRALAFGLLLGLLTQGVTTQAMAQPSTGSPTRFDGQWSVSIVCQTTTDGAAGYITNFMAEIRNGTLHGEHGVRRMSGWLSLDGKIQPDGKALLLASGLTGSSNFNVGKVMPDTPYSYHIDAHFDAAKGSGIRVEVRPCNATFAKA